FGSVQLGIALVETFHAGRCRASQMHTENTNPIWIDLFPDCIRHCPKRMLGRGKLAMPCPGADTGARIDEHNLPLGSPEQWQSALGQLEWASNICPVQLIEIRRRYFVHCTLGVAAAAVHEDVERTDLAFNRIAKTLNIRFLAQICRTDPDASFFVGITN